MACQLYGRMPMQVENFKEGVPELESQFIVHTVVRDVSKKIKSNNLLK